MTVSILGVEYTIEYRKYQSDPWFERMSASGYCSKLDKLIVVGLISTFPNFEHETESVICASEQETLRHEIVHAFLYESGLSESFAHMDGGWATNEEMVDWFAIQGPKIFAAWKEVGAI